MHLPKILFLGLAVMVLAACTPNSQTATTNDTATGNGTNVALQATDTTPAKVMPADDTDALVEEDTTLENTLAEADFAIEMVKFSYTPNELSAAPGETITVYLESTDGLHDLVIDELDVASSQLNSGESETIEITVPEDAVSGTEYEFYCSVGNHREMGMVGTFTVL